MTLKFERESFYVKLSTSLALKFSYGHSEESDSDTRRRRPGNSVGRGSLHAEVVPVVVDSVQHHTTGILADSCKRGGVMFSHSNNVNINGGEFHVTSAKISLTPEEVKKQEVQKGKQIFVHS